MLRRFLVVLCLLTCLGEVGAREPAVGDHVMIEVAQNSMVNYLYECFILNITDTLYCVNSIGYWDRGEWVDEINPGGHKYGTKICIGAASIKRIDWMD